MATNGVPRMGTLPHRENLRLKGEYQQLCGSVTSFQVSGEGLAGIGV